MNNRGFGLKSLIVFLAILFAFVIIVYFEINYLLGNGDFTYTNNNYTKVEESVKKAASKYFNSNGGGSVTTDTLITYGLLDKSVLSLNKDSCSGYATITDSKVKAYIHCSHYETKGYES